MRSLVLAAIGLGLLSGGLSVKEAYAQDDGGIARLSSEAYAPDSPVRENQLFRYQTGHYGFAYNCDGEECKRNNPAICWRKADQCQLPKRMGCLERIRHEAAQVSRRILDGTCDPGCQTCKQEKRHVSRTCGCTGCRAKQHHATANQSTHSLASTALAPTASASTEPVSANGPRSGLLSVTSLEFSSQAVELNPGEVIVGDIEILPTTEVTVKPLVKSIHPPVARITSATVATGAESVVEVLSENEGSQVAEVSPPSPKTDSKPSHPTGLLERLKKARSAQASSLSKAKKF